MVSFNYASVVFALNDSVKRHLSDGVLLSGGLDTGILTYLASRYTRPVCITVALQGTPGQDVAYATYVAHDIGLIHHIHYFDYTEIDNAIRDTIRILQCYDPMEIRNSATVYIALQIAKILGLNSVMTGDGGDELFAGYSFFFPLDKKQLEIELMKLWSCMSFSSIPLAKDLGMTAKLPILDTQFKESAMKIPAELKVKREKGQIWGKWILRKAFQGIVPDKILWRIKEPIEIGSGSTTLPQYYESTISDSIFKEKKTSYLVEDKVNIRDKEHLYYYEIYRNIYGCPNGTGVGDKICPDCGVKLSSSYTFCKLCGAYPI